MTARQSSLAELANAFGRCAALSARSGATGAPAPQTRLRKIARLMDRLARQPTNRSWHHRVAVVHGEIEATLREKKIRVTPGVLWAAA